MTQPYEAPPSERYINGRRVRAHAYVDENNLVYDLKLRGVSFNAIGWMLTIAVLLLLAWLVFAAPPQPASIAPSLPTAEIAPTSPRLPAVAPPSVDDGIASYNAAQRATAEALQASQAAPSATEAAPVSDSAAVPQEPAQEATPLPEPGAPDFAASFHPALCPPEGAYYTPLKGSPCYGRAGQTPLTQPGDEGFADSFGEAP